MPKITSVKARLIYNSRGTKTIEVDVTSDNKFLGRVCAPSGVSVGKHEAVNFPDGDPKKSFQLVTENSEKIMEIDSADLKSIHDTIRTLDPNPEYSKIGGAVAFAVTIASLESAAKALDVPLFQLISKEKNYRFPFPLGNILGGGAHAGPGTPDIQEILICAIGAKSIRDAIEANLSIHKELRNVLQKEDPSFTNGRGDEGGWAPKLGNE